MGRWEILENTGVCVRSGVLSPPPTLPCAPSPALGRGGLQFASVLSRLGLICIRMSGTWRGGLVLGSLGIFLPLSRPSGRLEGQPLPK